MGLTRNETVFGKIESSYGVDSVPAGANAIQTADIPGFDPLANAVAAERNIVRANTLAKPAGLFGGAAPTISFPVEMKGSGSLGVAPEWGPLLRACGFVETINAGVSVVYSPRAAGTTFESVTIYHWQDGLRYILRGCRGNVTMKGVVGEYPTLEFSFTGLMTLDSHTDTAQPTPTYDATVPVTFKANNFLSVGGFNPAFTEFSWDAQWQTAVGKNANSADGFGEVRLTGRQVVVKLDPEHTSKATQDWLGDIQTNTPGALSMVLGSAGGNRISIAAPALVPNSMGMGDRDGIRTLDYGYIANESASLNDELVITID